MGNKRVIHEVALFVCPYFGFVYCIQYLPSLEPIFSASKKKKERCTIWITKLSACFPDVAEWISGSNVLVSKSRSPMNSMPQSGKRTNEIIKIRI